MFKKLALAAVLVSSLSCAKDHRTVEVPPAALTKITLTPRAVTIMKDRSVQFTATGMYADGGTKDITTGVEWSIDDSTVASISVNGYATALKAGSTTIRATKDALSAEANLTVATSMLVRIALEPMTGNLVVGRTLTLSARATLGDETELDVSTSVDWFCSDNRIATVNDGVVTAIAPGSVVIDVRDPVTSISTTQGGSTMVTVRPVPPTSMMVRPDSVMLAQGLTQQYTATAIYPDQAMVDVSDQVTWNSSAPSVASVSPDGLVTSLSAGISSIEATDPVSGIHASATIRVLDPTITRIDVLPNTPTIGRGNFQVFQAMATYTDGSTRDLTAAVTWSSSNTAVATLDARDRAKFNGVGVGTATIRALDPVSNLSSEATMSSAILTVTPPQVMSVAVLPNALTLPLGLTQQLSAVAVLTDNSSLDITSRVSWDSSTPAVASVDASGFVTTLSTGQTMLSASDPVSGITSVGSGLSAALMVTPPALLSLSVTPSARAMIVGGTQQFTATGHYTDGADINRTANVSWSSTDPSVTISSTGLASAQHPGSGMIVATDTGFGISSNDSNESAVVTVNNATLLSIQVTPTTTSAPAGATIRFTATGTYDNMTTADLTALVTWISSNPTNVEIGNAAALRGAGVGRAIGMATISALEPVSGVSSDTSGGSATFNTISDTLSSLAVSPRTIDVASNRTRQFTAAGTFSSGNRYNMTNGVQWSSSNTALLTISNVDPNRGLASGVAVGGPLTVSALHTVSGISSNDSSQSATVHVIQGQVTAGVTWTGTPFSEIDGTSNFGVNVGTVTFGASVFPPTAVVQDVNVAINFLKTDGSCAVPANGDPFHAETNFALLGPTGTQVIMAPPMTWISSVAISPVTITFDQQATMTPSGTPVTGTFQPVMGSLSSFNGTNPAGTWTLQAGDTAGGDPLCVFSYTITVVAQ